MITFILYALSFISGTPVPGTVYWLTGLVDGVVFLPLMSLVMVPYLGRITREKIGRLHYLQAAFPMDAIVCVLTPWGYEFAPVRELAVEDETGVDEWREHAILADGTAVELDDERTWFRLGNRRFGVTYLPDERVLGETHVDADGLEFETVVVEDEQGQQQPAQAVFDHGGVLSTVRGGFHGWTPYVDLEDIEGYLVSLSRAINSLREGGGVRLSERTERMARVEHGGAAAMSNRGQIYAYLGVIALAAAFTVLAMWLMG